MHAHKLIFLFFPQNLKFYHCIILQILDEAVNLIIKYIFFNFYAPQIGGANGCNGFPPPPIVVLALLITIFND